MASPYPQRWLECECPTCVLDWDDAGSLNRDDLVQCPHCGAFCRAGDIGQMLVVSGLGQAMKVDLAWEGATHALPPPG